MQRPEVQRLLFVVTEDWYFLMHRLPMAQAAQAAGFDVHVATNVQKDGDAIRRLGFTLHPASFERGRTSPFSALRTIAALRRVVRDVKPVLVHHVSPQCIFLGSLAETGLPVASVNGFTGLGHLFMSKDLKTRALRAAIRASLGFLFNREATAVLVENPDDAVRLEKFGIEARRIVLIPSSGVDVERLRPMPEPTGAPAIAFAGRLIENKGIRTLLEAHRVLRGRGVRVELLIAGTPDPAKASSLTEGEMASWSREAGVNFLGHIEDIAQLWARAAVCVLPSRGGEGVPMSLLEAAAAGRPLIATDVPGCRDIVVPGKTGMLVPVNDAAALAGAIETMVGSAELRAHYGAAARALAVERFSAVSVGQQTVQLYRNLLTTGRPTGC